MAERIFLPINDESDDLVMRLTYKESSDLYSLLSKLRFKKMMDKGLSLEECAAISRILHVTY